MLPCVSSALPAHYFANSLRTMASTDGRIRPPMKPTSSLPLLLVRPQSDFRVLFAALATVVLASGLAAQTPAKKSSPTSKLYVADLTGHSQIDDGEHVLSLAKNDVRSPEGTTIETTADSTDSLVLSNGTAIYVAPETRFEVKRFLQEPFAPNRNNLDDEPSVSQTVVQVVHGTLGLCTSKLVAGSTMTYKTPEATISIRGRRLLIETLENETRVSLLEGDVTVVGDDAQGSETLRGGQRAIIHRPTANGPAVIKVEPIPDDQSSKIDDTVSLACISRRTVYFESVPTANGTNDLVAVRATPATAPTAYTVSPARINQ